ncbi:MAG TPA: DNA replication and repair protein RecF [Polyangiaceae bacterium]|nr:DNA replication and repair protein RecF [Polyangiaceae bacterium]
MAASLAIAAIALRNFRNIAVADLTDLARFTVFSGNNGQGKTSVLEAAYLVCTTRSFRTAKLSEIVRHGEEIASVRGKLTEGGDGREQVIGLRGSIRTVSSAGKRPPSLASYAVQSPAVVFHPGEMVLSSGPASKRRTLLDRIALFVDPTSMDHLKRYTVASRSRQRLLETRGTAAPEIDGFESIIARHGAAINRIRREACSRIALELGTSFPRITAETRLLEAIYEPGGPDAEDALRSALEAERERDRYRGSASSGPHRDDLVLRLGGYDVRVEASQGEHRVITMALKLAELGCIAAARGIQPVLLLDDVSSELDLSRTALLFDFLRETPGQILLTTTRPGLIDTRSLAASERRDFHLRGGVAREGPSPSET